mgnify:CR=1 FL=1
MRPTFPYSPYPQLCISLFSLPCRAQQHSWAVLLQTHEQGLPESRGQSRISDEH